MFQLPLRHSLATEHSLCSEADLGFMIFFAEPSQEKGPSLGLKQSSSFFRRNSVDDQRFSGKAMAGP